MMMKIKVKEALIAWWQK